MFSLMISSALLVGYEIINYINYLKTMKFTKKKRYFTNKVSSKKLEDFLLNDLNSNELENLIENSFSHNVTDNHKYYSEIKINNIPRNKMFKWTTYYLYFKSLWQLNDFEKENANHILNKIEEKLNLTFPDTENPHLYFLKFGGNRVECHYRPAFVDLILNGVKHCAYASLRLHGFKQYEMEQSNMKYFYYNNPKNKKTVLFIHGLGLGVTPYLSYLYKIKDKCNIIAPILPNISNMDNRSIFQKINVDAFFPSYEIIREDFKEMLNYHNIDSIDVIGHSFGTIMMGILIKDDELANKFNKKVFIDPVCFIDKSYQIFKYINEQGNADDSITNVVFNMLVYYDINIRYITQRYLYGPEFWILDFDKLNNNKSLIVLSIKDSMVPSKSIYKRCCKYNVPCITVNDAQHADIFILDEFKGVWNAIASFVYYE